MPTPADVTSYSEDLNQLHSSHADQRVTTGIHTSSHVVAAGASFALWDNSDDLISHDVEKWISLVNGLVLIPLFTLLGVPGNIVSAVVFYRHGLRERINLCLFALAIVDLVVVLILFLPYFESQLRLLLFPQAYFFTTYSSGLAGFVWASQFLSAVIASERCFCVVSPFHAKRLLKTSTMAAIIVVCCLVLVGGMGAIAGPKHAVIELPDAVTNTSKATFYVTRYYLDNKAILDDFDIFVYATSLPGLFLFVIIITTSITIVTLRSSALQRNCMTSASGTGENSSKPTNRLSSKDVGVTRMLIGTSALFIGCVTPNFVGQLTTFFVPDLSFSGRYYNTNMVMWDIVQFLRVVNSSVTVFIYYIMGSRFRQSSHEVLHHFCAKGQKTPKYQSDRSFNGTLSK